jgi:hypothetical protein
MIGMNIPTTIFSLISCFTAVSTEDLVLIIPAPLFCIFQLFGLTSIPARVHTAVIGILCWIYDGALLDPTSQHFI